MKKISLLLLIFTSLTLLVGCDMMKMDNEFVSYCTEYPEASICTEEQVSKETQIKNLLITYQNAQTDKERIEFCDAFVNQSNTDLKNSCEKGDASFLPDDFADLGNQFTVIESDSGVTRIEITNEDGEGYLFDVGISEDNSGFIQINTIDYEETKEYIEYANASFEEEFINLLNDLVNEDIGENEIIVTYFREGYNEEYLKDEYKSWRSHFNDYSIQYVRFVEYYNNYYVLDIGYTVQHTYPDFIQDIEFYEVRVSASLKDGMKLLPLFGGHNSWYFYPDIDEATKLVKDTSTIFDFESDQCYKRFTENQMYFRYPDQSPLEACGEWKGKLTFDGDVVSVELDPVSDSIYNRGYLATFEYVDPNGGSNKTETKYIVFAMATYGLTINTVGTYEWYQEYINIP